MSNLPLGTAIYPKCPTCGREHGLYVPLYVPCPQTSMVLCPFVFISIGGDTKPVRR